MKVIIAGGRDFDNWQYLYEVCSEYITEDDVEIVSGGAKGADRLGEKFAKLKNIPLKVFIPDWDTYGKSAGHIRNKQMAKYADKLIAFWDGKSPGTMNMIDTALKYGLKVHIFTYEHI